MKSFKDFYYDKNDIIVALAILLIAGLIIMWRVSAIMDYPQTLAEETDTVQTTEEAAISDTGSSGTDDVTGEPDQIWMGGQLTRDITITVSGGSATSAAECLVSIGLFDSYDQFAEVCKSAKCNPEDIKANTFTFEKGCTQTDIAKEVTD